jgi:hypothetical protein
MRIQGIFCSTEIVFNLFTIGVNRVFTVLHSDSPAYVFYLQNTKRK